MYIVLTMIFHLASHFLERVEISGLFLISCWVGVDLDLESCELVGGKIMS